MKEYDKHNGDEQGHAAFVQSYAEIRDKDCPVDEQEKLFVELAIRSPYTQHLVRVVLGLLRMPPDLAPDVLQSTAEKLLRYDFPRMKNGKIRGFIFIVLRNNAISIQRSMNRHSLNCKSFSGKKENNFYGKGHAYKTSKGEIIFVNYMELWEAIYILEKEDADGATCIKLDLVDMRLKDIADEMGVSVGRARSIVVRAIRRLKVILERENRR